MNIAHLDYPARDLIVRSETFWEKSDLRLKPCAKEPGTVRWLEENIKEGDVFYDVGACIGAYSLIAAHLGAMVYAFEPHAATYSHLCDNVIMNGFTESIFPLPLALLERNSLRPLFLSDMEAGAAEHILDDAEGVPQTVMGMKMDDARKVFRLRSPDFIKVDVDGAEKAVLDGTARTLPYARGVIIEVSDETSEYVKWIMMTADLKLTQSHPLVAKGARNEVYERA